MDVVVAREHHGNAAMRHDRVPTATLVGTTFA